MSDDERRHLQAITEVCREAILKVCRPDSCIATTRVLISVLEYFGYASEPLPCRTIVWNAAGFEASEASLSPGDAGYPPDAHSVGVAGTGFTRKEGRRWDGHLVAMVQDRWLIDPSLDQFSRPERGMTVTSPFVADAAGWDRTLMRLWRRRDGVVFGYQLMPEPGAWRTSPDWRTERYRDVVGDVIRYLKAAGVQHASSGQAATR